MIGPAHRLGDRLDRLEVAVGRDREAGLDDVDPEAGELLGDLELLGDVERDAGRLLAVSQGRVEDLDRVHLVRLGVVLGVFAATKNPPAGWHGGRSASTYVRPRLHKEEAQQCCGSRCLLAHKSDQSVSSSTSGSNYVFGTTARAA